MAGSICSAHASMPPSRLYAARKPGGPQQLGRMRAARPALAKKDDFLIRLKHRGAVPVNSPSGISLRTFDFGNLVFKFFSHINNRKRSVVLPFWRFNSSTLIAANGSVIRAGRAPQNCSYQWRKDRWSFLANRGTEDRGAD
jgi:hypothetical protein